MFEAPIDLLSFIQLFPKDWEQRSYLSLGGTSDRALTAFLSDSPNITSVFLCLDNDKAGEEACEKIAGKEVPCERIIRLKPVLKDWNEIICHQGKMQGRNPVAETVVLKAPEKEEIVRGLWPLDIICTESENAAFGLLYLFRSWFSSSPISVSKPSLSKRGAVK